MIIDGKWQRVQYDVQKINLTPAWMGSPLVAFGLKPSRNSSAPPPLLIFKGTTYPTDRGFGLSLLTDLNPGDSVGGYAFRLGRKKIGSWLAQHTNENTKAIVYGKSLGGALSWRTALHFSAHIQKVMAYGAPGFSSSEVKRLKRNMQQKSHPEIHMFCQKGDHVPYFDKMPRQGVHYYLVLGEKERSGLLAHADMYSTHQHSAVIRLNIPKEAGHVKRLSLTAMRFALSLSLFPLLVMVYSTHYAVRKSVRSIDKRIRR